MPTASESEGLGIRAHESYSDPIDLAKLFVFIIYIENNIVYNMLTRINTVVYLSIENGCKFIMDV